MSTFIDIINLGDIMFILIIIVAIILLMIYELVGSGTKRLLKIEFNGFNLIIGYLVALLIYYLLSSSLFVFSLIALLPLIYFGFKDKRSRFDYIIIIMIMIYLSYFFSFNFIVPHEISDYLINLNHEINLTVFQHYTLNFAKVLHFHPTVYTINVVTLINLFIVLYTIYECLQIFIVNKKNSRYAFLLFLLLFTIVNTASKNIVFPQNAYYFLYHPFSGITVYLYGIIPLQFILFSRLNRKNDFLLVLINFAALAFTSLSLFMQVIFNTSYFVLIMINKNDHYLTRFVFLAFIPLSFQLLLFNYSTNIKLIYLIVVSVLFMLSRVLLYEAKYNAKRVSQILQYLFFIIFIISTIFICFYGVELYQNKQTTYLYQNERAKILLYYGLVFYSLYKLWKEKNLRQYFGYYPLIVLVLIFNPLTLSFIVEAKILLPDLIFFLPLTFAIVISFFKTTQILEKALILLLIFSIGSTIYQPLTSINQKRQNVYFRIDQQVLEISNYLNQSKTINNFMTCETIADKIILNTVTANLLTTDNDELLYVDYMLNDKIPFDLLMFVETIENNNIDAVIIDKDKAVNSYLEMLCKSQKSYNYFIIYQF